MRGAGRGRPSCVDYCKLFEPSAVSYSLVNVLLPHVLCFRDLPDRPSQDTSSSPRPSGRQQVPRDPLQRHAPCHSEDRKRGGAPSSLFRVSMANLCACVSLVVSYSLSSPNLPNITWSLTKVWGLFFACNPTIRVTYTTLYIFPLNVVIFFLHFLFCSLL